MISEAMKSHASFATPFPSYLQPHPPPPASYPPAMSYYGMPFVGLLPSQGYYPYPYHKILLTCHIHRIIRAYQIRL